MNLAKMIAPSNLPAPQAAFRLAMSTVDNVVVDAVLQYIAPDSVRAEQEREQQRIIGRPKWNAAEDLVDQQRALDEMLTEIVAKQIVRFDKVTVRTLASLLPLDKEAVALAGGLGATVDFDPADPSPITDEERDRWGWGNKAATKGQVAAINIRSMLRFRPGLRDQIFQIVTDVSYFQGKDWEADLKNSGTGPDTNSGPASATPRETAPGA